MNPQSHRQPAKPKHKLAMTSLTLSIVAVLIVLAGTFIPTSELQVPVIRNASSWGGHLDYALIFLLPGILGFVAAGMGAKAIRQIEKSQEQVSGDGPAVFAVMIGLFAGIVGMVDLFALFWG